MTDPVVDAPLSQRANLNWSRYEYLRMRGHSDYCEQVLINERMYLGYTAGSLGQWDSDAIADLRTMNRMPVEINEIAPAIDAAIGYQISNRMDITFRPRGHGADDQTADTLSKVAMQIADSNRLHWKETDVFSNGMIDQRGYFDIRMCYDENISGEVEIDSLDPADVAPDADASHYQPDKWQDVTCLRWNTIDDIAQHHGQAKAEEVRNYGKTDYRDYADWSEERQRARFGNSLDATNWWDWSRTDIDSTRYRIVDRQYFVYEMCKVAVYTNTGDVKVLDGLEEEDVQKILATPGVVPSKRRMRRVKWLITTGNIVLFDDYSPWPFFTIVPFFPYFRKGKTRGMVDRAIWPQNLLNKATSTGLAIFAHLAKGVWQGEANNLHNMTEDDFRKDSAKPGFTIFLKDGSKPFKLEQPQQMPNAINDFIALGRSSIKNTTGVSEELLAQGSQDLSGVAIQARQYAAQQKLAIPLDNLAKTRNILASRILWFIQHYYTGPRIFRITEKDQYGKDITGEVAVNQEQPTGEVINDLTVGSYDVIVSEQPIAITFDNTQFSQLKDMKEMGYPVPAEWMVRYSNISDKAELTEAIEKQSQTPNPPDPLTQAEIDLKTQQGKKAAAETTKIENQAVQEAVVGIYSATQAAGEIAALPQVAGIADDILGSAGFIDRDAPPIINTPAGPMPVPGGIDAGAGLAEAAPPVPIVPPQDLPTNTDPTTPAGIASPRVGADAGIEKPGVQ